MFVELTEKHLLEYERQYFDVLRCDQIKGAVRYATANIKAAVAAGWMAEPVDVDGLTIAKRREMSRAIDETYSEAITIDPN